MIGAIEQRRHIYVHLSAMGQGKGQVGVVLWQRG